jgi:CHAT domain-containing protein
MSNQTSLDENATGFENSYSIKDFNPDIQDNLNLEETLDESANTEVKSKDSSSGISLTKTAIITIQLTPNSEKAIVSIGIQDAPPIIKIIPLAEIKSQPIINNWLQDLEISLPQMLNICKQRMEKQTTEQNRQEQSKQVQKRNLPEDKDKKPAPNNQLSLF